MIIPGWSAMNIRSRSITAGASAIGSALVSWKSQLNNPPPSSSTPGSPQPGAPSSAETASARPPSGAGSPPHAAIAPEARMERTIERRRFEASIGAPLSAAVSAAP